VIAAWGISEDGRKVLLHLMAGSKEDTETVRAFFQDMRARGLRMRNLAVKVPTDLWPEFKARVAACYQAPSSSSPSLRLLIVSNRIS
jgi:transposase-like protein